MFSARRLAAIATPAPTDDDASAVSDPQAEPVKNPVTPELAYAPPLKAPGHVDDLLRLGSGCFWMSAVCFGLPFAYLLFASLRDGGTSWQSMSRQGRWLAIPALLGGVLWLSPRIREWAAERAAVGRGESLRPGEVVVVGVVLAKDTLVGRHATMRVRFAIDDVVVVGRRRVGDAARHRSRVGEPIDVAVDPRRRKRWRVIAPRTSDPRSASGATESVEAEPVDDPD